jgi:hypothetical protein
MLPYLPPYPAAEGVIARMAFILQAAMVYVASRVRQAVPGMGPAIIPVRFERLINLWLEARKRAIVELIRRIEAGTQKPPRPFKPRDAQPGPARPVATERAPGVRLPARFGWLCVIGREVGGPGGWLSRLLDEDMREMVTAHPRLARLIRPVLRMLGQRPPEWFPKTPKRARSTRTAPVARRTDQPVSGVGANDPSRELARYIDVERAKQYAADMARLYEGCGGPPPAVAKQIARFAMKAAPPAPAGSRASAPAAPAAEVSTDRDKYYYAETWNGKLIPVRRRWG